MKATACRRVHGQGASLATLALLLFRAACSLPAADTRELERENRRLEQKIAELEQRLGAAQPEEETVTLCRLATTPTDFWPVPELKRLPRQPDMLKAALEELIKQPSLPIPKKPGSWEWR